MGRMKAFGAALLAFALTVALGHLLGEVGTDRNPEGYALWASEEKSRSFAGLTENMTEQTLPVFGSSEFMHGKEEPFHPAQVFAGTDVTPMLIGAGYYQSLSHAVTLSAIEDTMPLKRAVLILSPQWFRKTGVVDQAYTSRFSEGLYRAMLENEGISQELKDYFWERTNVLLAPDPGTLEKVEKDKAYLAGEMHSPWDRFFEKIWLSFLEEKDRFSISIRQLGMGMGKTKVEKKEEIEEKKQEEKEEKKEKEEKREGKKTLTKQDWTELLNLAEKRGEQENQNPFYIGQESYERLLPYLPEKKGMNADADKGYQTGPEFNDLRSFVRTARETGIEVMLVLVPVNGYYYDFTEFPSSARQAYYEKIRNLAREEGAYVADFAGQEYTKYFFEDRVHLGKVGWVMVDEAIYRFAKEGAPNGQG